MGPFRDDLEAAHERIARLESANTDLQLRNTELERRNLELEAQLSGPTPRELAARDDEATAWRIVGKTFAVLVVAIIAIVLATR